MPCLPVPKSGPAELGAVEKLGEGAASAVENYTHGWALQPLVLQRFLLNPEAPIPRDVDTEGHSYSAAVPSL